MNDSKRKCPKCGTAISKFESTCPICYRKMDFVENKLEKEEEKYIEDILPMKVMIPSGLTTEEEIDWLLCRLVDNSEGKSLIKNYAVNYPNRYWEQYLKAVFIYYLYDYNKKCSSKSSYSFLLILLVIGFLLLIWLFSSTLNSGSASTSELEKIVDAFPFFFVIGPLLLLGMLIIIYLAVKVLNFKKNFSKQLFLEFSERCDTANVTMNRYQKLFSVCPEIKLMHEKIKEIKNGSKVSK